MGAARGEGHGTGYARDGHRDQTGGIGAVTELAVGVGAPTLDGATREPRAGEGAATRDLLGRGRVHGGTSRKQREEERDYDGESGMR